MRSSHSLDRLAVTFDDERAVADAGLLLPATLAQHLGLVTLVDERVDLGDTPGRANPGIKVMTLVHSLLAGGDCIDDADALRAGATEAVLGHGLRAPSTLGTFLRSFTWGGVRQLDAVNRELLARAWAAGAGPGDAPLTIDVDSTICETYGLLKQGGSKFTYSHVRGYHPLLAIVAGTGDVVHARLRGGNANSGRGAAGFLTETFARVRAAGASGPVTLRADSGFYSASVVRACRRANVRFSITVKLTKALHKTIAAIPDDAWTPIPYFLDGADVAETTYVPFAHKGARAPLRLVVRRVRPTPGSQLALFCEFSYHALITDREGDTLDLEADHRRHAEVENTIRDLKYGTGLNHLPSGRFGANGAWLACNVIAHNLARWTSRVGLGENLVTTKTLRRRHFRLSGRLTRSARVETLHLPARWPWRGDFLVALMRLRAIPPPATV
ncbi:MAG: IS1380 family transposase [Candidatus Rokuibacteriota bacterium]